MKKNFRVYVYEIESDDQNDSDIIDTYVLRNITLEDMQKHIEDNFGLGSTDVKFEEVK